MWLTGTGRCAFCEACAEVYAVCQLVSGLRRAVQHWLSQMLPAVQIKKPAPEKAEKKPKMYEKKVKGGKQRQSKGGVKKKVKSK